MYVSTSASVYVSKKQQGQNAFVIGAVIGPVDGVSTWESQLECVYAADKVRDSGTGQDKTQVSESGR